MTVDEAIEARAALTGDAAKVADLIDACLNAAAAFRMMGVKLKPGRGFKPVGALTLGQITNLLATMPAETALVTASMAAACEFCGSPAETMGEDFWICEPCIERANQPARSLSPTPDASTEGNEGGQTLPGPHCADLQAGRAPDASVAREGGEP